MTAEKCCFCLKLETGCFLLGITTFAVSLIKMILTAVFILPKHAKNVQLEASNVTSYTVDPPSSHSHHQTNHLLDLVADKSLKTVVVGFIMIICFLWMIISLLLIIGILKRKVSFVMTYFLFGSAMSIMYLLSGLLEVISGFWITSLCTFLLTLAYIKCLASVYAAYDMMRQLKATDDQEQLIDDEPIIEF